MIVIVAGVVAFVVVFAVLVAFVGVRADAVDVLAVCVWHYCCSCCS